MSRIIEFRGWSVEEKKMYKPAFPTWNGGVEVWRDNKPQTTTVGYHSQHGPEEQMILEQYTGLKDKNGVEIYEGDYIYFEDDEYVEAGQTINTSWISTIKFEQYAWKCIDSFSGDDMFIEDMHNDGIVDGTVIGNIHDTPEVIGNIHEGVKSETT